MQNVIERVVRWLVFSVTLGMVPIVFGAYRLSTLEQTGTVSHSLSIVISHGELLIAAALLCGGASGEIVGSSRGLFRVLKTIMAGAAIVVLLFSAMYYADVTVAQLFGKPVDFALVQRTSLRVFVASVTVGGFALPSVHSNDIRPTRTLGR